MKVGEVYALLGMDFSQFDKDERTAKQRTQTLGASLSGIIKNAFSFTIGMGFFQAIQQGFRASVGSALDFNVTMEQARIGFETMLGSASRAESLLSNLASFAERTPFEFSGLLDASKRMLALGFSADRIIPTLTAVGNAAAGLGTGQQGIDRIILALGQMQAKGKVTGEEMRQLTEAGIEAWDILAESMGKSRQEVMALSERGLIPADRAVQALVDGMGARFPDMMKRMENSWMGLTSTIREVWKMTIGEVTSGLFERAKEWLKGIRDTMTGFREAFRAGGLTHAIEQAFGPRTAASIGTLTAALKGLWGIVSSAGKTIIANWSTIAPLTGLVVKGFLAFKTASLVVGIATGAVNTFKAAILAMQGSLVAGPGVLKLVSDVVLYYKCLIPATAGTFSFSTALTYLRTALLAVQTALGAVIWPILIIGALLMGGTALWSKYTQAVQSAAQKAQMDKMAQQQKEYMDAVNKAAQGTGNQADALGELGKAASKNLQSFDEVHSLAEDTAGLDSGALGDLLGGTPTIPEMPEFELDAFSFDFDTAIAEAKAEMGGFWGWLKTSAADAWGSVKEWAGNLWDGVKDKWAGFKVWFGSWAGPLWDGVKEKWGSFKEWAGGLWDGVKEKWGGFKTWAGETWDGIKTTLGEKWQGIKTKAAETWDGMKTKASETWSNIKTGAATGWENIKTTVATKWDALKVGAANTWEQVKTGASIAWQNIKTDAVTGWEGIKTTAATKWESFKAGAAETWEKVRTEASTAWQNLKADAATGWENIKTTAATKWDSFKTGAAETWEQVKTNAGTAWENLKTTINTGWGNIRNDTNTAWDNIKADLKTAWENLKTDAATAWDNLKTTISNGWAKIKEGAKTWGQRVVEAFTGGMNSTSAAQAAAGVAQDIANNIGFESPTREGPGRYADRWAPNLMRMYAKGILDNVSMVQSAAGQVARSLMPMTAVPAPAFAGMGAGGGTFGARSGSLADELAAALRGVGGIGSNRPIEVTINIDGRRMARALIPAIQSEQERVEMETIIRTK